MKKTLLVALVLALATSAQAVLWDVPTDALEGNAVVTAVPGVTVRFMDATYTHQLAGAVPAITIAGTAMDDAWQGSNNPKPWLHTPPYAMWAFDCTVDGTLNVGFAINKAKLFYITDMPIMNVAGVTYTSAEWPTEYTYSMTGDDGSVITSEATFAAALAANDASATGCKFYGQYRGVYPGRLWNADSTAATGSWISEVIPIQAKAGRSYCVFVTGSKLGFFGFDFTAGSAIAPTRTDRTLVSTRYFNLSGVEVPNVGEGCAKGLYLAKKKYSDGSVESSKFLVQ